jgi:hypothetical protein
MSPVNGGADLGRGLSMRWSGIGDQSFSGSGIRSNGDCDLMEALAISLLPIVSSGSVFMAAGSFKVEQLQHML